MPTSDSGSKKTQPDLSSITRGRKQVDELDAVMCQHSADANPLTEDGLRLMPQCLIRLAFGTVRGVWDSSLARCLVSSPCMLNPRDQLLRRSTNV